MNSFSYNSAKKTEHKICPLTGLEIAELIIKDKHFAQKFFYPEDPYATPSIGPLRIKLIGEIKRNFGISLNPHDVSTILYEHLWSKGDWKVLLSYNGTSSIFTWLSTVGYRCIVSYLIKDGTIDEPQPKPTRNASIDFDKLETAYLYTMITETMHIPLLRDILLARHVDKLSEKSIQKKFSMDESLYRLALAAAEKSLLVVLLNSQSIFIEAVTFSKTNKKRVSSDCLAHMAAQNEEQPEPNQYAKLLGISPDDPYLECKTAQILRDFSQNHMNWQNESDQYIWEARVLDEIPSEEVAKRLGCTTQWLYVRLFRLKERFNAAFIEHITQNNR